MLGTQTKINRQMLKDSYALPRADNSPPVILIADDDDDSRLMLKFLLESWNYLVIEAVNGAEAFCIAETEKPDLILMDVKMPDLDGFERRGKSVNPGIWTAYRSSFFQAAPNSSTATGQRRRAATIISSNRSTLTGWQTRSANISDNQLPKRSAAV